MWGVRGMSVDTDGNFHVAEVDNGGVQKYRPRPGAIRRFWWASRSAWKLGRTGSASLETFLSRPQARYLVDSTPDLR
jgi:hypothetical protein